MLAAGQVYVNSRSSGLNCHCPFYKGLLSQKKKKFNSTPLPVEYNALSEPFPPVYTLRQKSIPLRPMLFEEVGWGEIEGYSENPFAAFGVPMGSRRCALSS